MSRVLLLALIGLAFLGGSASGGSRQFRVAYVTDLSTPPGPHDLRGAGLLGFQRALKAFNIEGRVVLYDLARGQAPTLTSLARQKYDLIFTALAASDKDFQSIGTVARLYRRSLFVLPDAVVQDLRVRPKNVVGSDWRVEQPSYLAGFLAGLEEKRRAGPDVIGSVGGYSYGAVNRYIAGYRAGARHADPGIRTVRLYANDFLDKTKCATVARIEVAKGAGVVFPVAGDCGIGALAVAKEKGVWGIGADVDQSYLGSHILTSVLKGDRGQDVYRTIKAFVEGKLRGGNEVWDLRSGAVGLGKISPKVPRSFVRKVEEIRKQIVAGKIKVPATLGR
jgi:basic membrane protein A and related proteins